MNVNNSMDAIQHTAKERTPSDNICIMIDMNNCLSLDGESQEVKKI